MEQEEIKKNLGCAPHPKCPHLKDVYGIWIVCDETGEDCEHYNLTCNYCKTGIASDGVDTIKAMKEMFEHPSSLPFFGEKSPLKEKEEIIAELKLIRAKIKKKVHEEYIPYTGGYTERTLNPEDVFKIIDDRIKQLEDEK